MSASNREASIRVTLVYEGGYTNDPHDPGGPTNWGITIFDARKHWKPDATAEDVRAMPLSVAIDIYRRKYWSILGCDALPIGVDLVTFDYGVNSGVHRAAETRDCTRIADAVVWVKAICAERLSFLQHLKNWTFFGKGWGKRVANVEARGVRMALEARGNSPEHASVQMTGHAAHATKSSAIHAGAASGLATALAWLPHLDPATWAAVAILALPALSYCVWWAVHHYHRAKAYAHG